MGRASSSGMSEEMGETAPSSGSAFAENGGLGNLEPSRARSSTPVPSYAAPTASDIARKINGNKKRCRDDDFDATSFKRRAVSPGLSVQGSPVLPQSPGFNGEKSWGHPPPKSGLHSMPTGDRNNGGGSGSGSGSGSGKRIGLQGMTETHDSLMNMSIE